MSRLRWSAAEGALGRLRLWIGVAPPPLLLLLLGAGGLALGVAAEDAAAGWDDLAHAIPDAVTGWIVLGAGLVAWRRAPAAGAGPLLVLTGVAWFAGNFASDAAFLHRAPLMHLLLAFPALWPAPGPDRAAVLACYAAAAVAPVWRSDPAAIALAAAVVAVTALRRYRAVGAARRARGLALGAASGFAAVVATGAAARLAVPAGDADDPALLAYEATLCALAGLLAWGAVARPWERARLADLVVELGGRRSGTLREALARALGDPTLEVGYRAPGSEGYTDADGRPLALPAPGGGRAVTLVEGEGGPLAALVHDEAVLEDPRLVDAVAAAARMGAANAELHARVRAQIAELRSSGRRLVAVGDEERRRLEASLREGAGRRLQELEALLDGVGERVERARELLARAREDLDDVARGLHPRALSEHGLAAALGALAEAAQVRVELDVDAVGLPADVEAAAYFVCAEALANATKHAAASRVRIAVRARDGRLALVVDDDGAGGADPGRGSGLRGLADRVEALGGSLRVDSPPGGGTRLAAELPLGGETG